MNLSLSEILKIKSLNANFAGNEQILNHNISGVSIDSRTVESNQLFFAIQGENFDARQFIPDVLKKQAVSIVVDHEWYDFYICLWMANFSHN